MKTIISGASDDLIDISGTISEELGYSGSQTKISASDGTVAYIELDSHAHWNIHVTTSGDALEKEVPWNRGQKHDDFDCIRYMVADYSDALVFNKPLEWVKVGRYKCKPHDQIPDPQSRVTEEPEKEEVFCPECCEPTTQEELNTFGGLCETCTEE